jgi:hypothetical protein
MINTWTNSAGVRDGSWATLGGDVSHDSYTDGAWVGVRIEVYEDRVVLEWDGDVLFETPVSVDTTHETVGFTAGTGYYTAEYALRDIVYSAF